MILFILFIIIILYLFYQEFIYREEIRFYIYPSSTDPNFVNQVTDIIKKCKWNDKFELISTTSLNNADVSMELANRESIKFDDDSKYPNGEKIYFSVTSFNNSIPHTQIDNINWRDGVSQSGLNLTEYRKYLIIHEFGHLLGYDHQECSNGICPVMHQATRGTPIGSKHLIDVTAIDYTNPIND